MKLKIFAIEIWRRVFNPRELHPGTPEKPPESKQNPQESNDQTLGTEIQGTKDKNPLNQETLGGTKRKKSTKVQDEKSDKSSIVRSELNLEQNSVFTISTYRGKSREVVARGTSPAGEIYERKAIIGRTIDGIETGVLTTHHFKLYLAFIRFWEEAGRPVKEPVHFTVLRIIKALGMINSGSNYEMIKRNLVNLRQIPITFINSFYLLDEGMFRTLEPFSILSRLSIYERKKVGRQQKTYGYGEFRFDDNILESLINNHTHPLRLDVVNSFKKHKDLSILLYIYLDRNLAFKDKYEIGLEKLFDHLDLSQKQIRYPSDRKAKIEPVLEQLRGKELSTGVLSYTQVLKTKDGKDYKLVCRKKPFPKKLNEQEVPPQLELTLPTKIGSGSPETGSESVENGPESAKSSSEPLPLLIEKGLTQKQAAKLVAEKSSEVIIDQLAYLPFRVKEYESQRKEINEPAILYESINDNWKVPKSYLEAEKEKERKAERLERERMARLEQEGQDRAEQERIELEAYKETLDPEERKRLRERALEGIRSMEGVKAEFITGILIEA